MKGIDKSIIGILIALIMVSGCQIQRHEIEPNTKPTPDKTSALRALKSFEVDVIGLDYIADCKARIKTRDKSYSGSCSLILTRNHELKLMISHPLGGTLLELYADKYIVQMNDYSEREYFEFEYGERKRIDLPIIRSLSIVELQSVLWGRLTEKSGETLKFEFHNDKPSRMVKSSGAESLSAVYKSWLTHRDLIFPKILEVSNSKAGTSAKLAIINFQPGFAGELKLKKLSPSSASPEKR